MAFYGPVVTLPKTTKDVRGKLITPHKADKEQARDILRLILSSVHFLTRQGPALRGDGNDVSGNVIKMLHLRNDDKPEVLQWLDRGVRKYTATVNPNKILELMAHYVLRRFLKTFRAHSSLL